MSEGLFLGMKSTTTKRLNTRKVQLNPNSKTKDFSSIKSKLAIFKDNIISSPRGKPLTGKSTTTSIPLSNKTNKITPYDKNIWDFETDLPKKVEKTYKKKKGAASIVNARSNLLLNAEKDMLKTNDTSIDNFFLPEAVLTFQLASNDDMDLVSEQDNTVAYKFMQPAKDNENLSITYSATHDGKNSENSHAFTKITINKMQNTSNPNKKNQSNMENELTSDNIDRLSFETMNASVKSRKNSLLTKNKITSKGKRTSKKTLTELLSIEESIVDPLIVDHLTDQQNCAIVNFTTKTKNKEIKSLNSNKKLKKSLSPKRIEALPFGNENVHSVIQPKITAPAKIKGLKVHESKKIQKPSKLKHRNKTRTLVEMSQNTPVIHPTEREPELNAPILSSSNAAASVALRNENTCQMSIQSLTPLKALLIETSGRQSLPYFSNQIKSLSNISNSKKNQLNTSKRDAVSKNLAGLCSIDKKIQILVKRVQTPLSPNYETDPLAD